MPNPSQTDPADALVLATWAIAVSTPDGHTAILSQRYPLDTDAITAASQMNRATVAGFEFKPLQIL
jgi:hypothetical protein